MNGMLQKLDMPNESLDVICCISVLEHTDNYGEIVREFARVLKRGGLLVLTFDLSLDGKFERESSRCRPARQRFGILRHPRRPYRAGTEPNGRREIDPEHRSCQANRT